METVVVAGLVLQEQRRRLPLPCRVAPGHEFRVLVGEAYRNAHHAVPPVGHRGQPAVQLGPEAGNHRRQRIVEVLVLAPAEAMPGHDHSSPEPGLGSVKPGQFPTLLGRKQTLKYRITRRIEVLDHARPVIGIDSVGDCRGVDAQCRASRRAHRAPSLWSSARLRSTPQR
jgi:hypothetical protein